ncbi:MAG: hypothetical protein KDD84_24780, partial [Caldilineaceae bacterium]|nr:hypothetical protein [Caldilineaceae bacterium]
MSSDESQRGMQAISQLALQLRSLHEIATEKSTEFEKSTLSGAETLNKRTTLDQPWKRRKNRYAAHVYFGCCLAGR